MCIQFCHYFNDSLNWFRTLSWFCCLWSVFSASPLNAEGFAEKKVLILQSDDTRLKAGQWLSETISISLAPRTFARIMSESGEVSKINGPYTGAISSAIQDEGSSIAFMGELAKAIFGRGESKKDFGAYRSVGEEKGAPRYRESFVRLLVGETGSYCVTPQQRIVFWRRVPTEKTLSVTISADTKVESTVIWPAGKQELKIPDAIILDKPRRLVLAEQGNLGLTSARLRYGEHGETPAEQLKWYLKYGCQSQFESALTFYQTF